MPSRRPVAVSRSTRPLSLSSDAKVRGPPQNQAPSTRSLHVAYAAHCRSRPKARHARSQTMRASTTRICLSPGSEIGPSYALTAHHPTDGCVAARPYPATAEDSPATAIPRRVGCADRCCRAGRRRRLSPASQYGYSEGRQDHLDLLRHRLCGEPEIIARPGQRPQSRHRPQRPQAPDVNHEGKLHNIGKKPSLDPSDLGEEGSAHDRPTAPR